MESGHLRNLSRAPRDAALDSRTKQVAFNARGAGRRGWNNTLRFRRHNEPPLSGAPISAPAASATRSLPTGLKGKWLPRQTLPRPVAFWLGGAVLFLMLAASAATAPLYPVYEARWKFSPATLTAVFAVFVLFVLITLLLCGSLSDYVGRRRVILVGTALEAVACVLFLLAGGVGALFGARALQGAAVGLTTGAVGAELLDVRPNGDLASLVSSLTATAGLAAGALIASALVQYGPAPTHLVWWLLLVAFVSGIPAVLLMPETGTRRPGALRSFRPRVAVPHDARGTFAAAACCLIGVWALGGFYLSLGPSLTAQLARSQNLLWAGVSIFLLTGLGAGASVKLRNSAPASVMLCGSVMLVIGALVTFGAILSGSAPALLLGTALAGLGFGPAFLGAYQTIIACAEGDDRAALVAAIYIVNNLAFGVPALIAGVTTTHYGLRQTALVYSLVVAALAALGAISFPLVRRRRPATPTYPRLSPGA
jgi:MFS family permease